MNQQSQHPAIAIAIGVGAVLLFAIIVTYSLLAKKKRKADSWIGTAIDKDVQEFTPTDTMYANQGAVDVNGFQIGRNNSVTHSYNLTIKTDDGRQLKWPVSAGMYQLVQIGDRLQKPAGTELPTVISKTSVSAETSPAAPADAPPPPGPTKP